MLNKQEQELALQTLEANGAKILEHSEHEGRLYVVCSWLSVLATDRVLDALEEKGIEYLRNDRFPTTVFNLW